MRAKKGSRASFCLYGLMSGLVLGGLIYVRKRITDASEDEEVKVDEAETFGGFGAPQGVPAAVPGLIVNNNN